MKKNDMYIFLLFIVIILIEYSVSDIRFNISFSIRSIVLSVVNLVYLLMPLLALLFLKKILKIDAEESYSKNLKMIFLFSFITFIVFPINVGYGVIISVVSIVITSLIYFLLNLLKIKFYNPYLISIFISIAFFIILIPYT